MSLLLNFGHFSDIVSTSNKHAKIVQAIHVALRDHTIFARTAGPGSDPGPNCPGRDIASPHYFSLTWGCKSHMINLGMWRTTFRY